MRGSLWSSSPGRIWIGAIPAGLFRSDDAGSTYTNVKLPVSEPR